MNGLHLANGLIIPEVELSEQTSLSSGPGGQHANKTSSRISLSWNIETSAMLTGGQRARLRKQLGHRLTRQGELQVHVQTHRSQHANRDAARQRMTELLDAALKPVKARRKTRPTLGSQKRRLENKRRRSGIKEGRRKPDRD